MDKPVGTKTGVHGSIHLMLDGVRYYGNKLAWFYMTGKFVDYVGFKDFNPNNLKWDNLECLTKQEYQLRIKAMIPSPVDGIRPVVKDYSTGQWYLQQRQGDKVIKGPYYGDPRMAVAEWAKIDEAKIRKYREIQKTNTRTTARFSATEIKQALKDYKISD